MENVTDQTGSERRSELRKILGVTFGIAITIGGMIGLGILRTPGVVAAQLQETWLIVLVWVLGGVYALLGVNCVAELATSVPECGGVYVYARRSLGQYGGFLIGWLDWIAYPLGLAFGSIIVGEYLGSLVPALSNYVTLSALLFMGLLTALNLAGLRAGSRVQEVTSFAKAAVFIILIIACFTHESSPTNTTLVPAANSLGLTAAIGALAIALQGVIYAYDGWHAASYLAEENTDPGRNLPRSMIGAVALVMVIYVLINLAFLYVLPISTLASSNLPAADAANVVFGERGQTIVTGLAILSLFAISNANMLTGPRILFAMSRDGLFPGRASEINSGGTPMNALLITNVATVPLILIGTFETMLAISAFLFIVTYMSAFLALFILRHREPDLRRPYRSWGHPITTGIVLVASVAFLAAAVIGDSMNALYALALIVASYPIYRLMFRSRSGNSENGEERTGKGTT